MRQAASILRLLLLLASLLLTCTYLANYIKPTNNQGRKKNLKKVNFETDVIKDFRQPEYGGNWSLNRNNVCFFSVFNTCHGSSPLFSWFSKSLILPRTPQEKPSNRGTKQTLWVLDLESLSCRCHIFLLQVVFGENTCTIKVPINGYFPSVIKVNNVHWT